MLNEKFHVDYDTFLEIKFPIMQTDFRSTEVALLKTKYPNNGTLKGIQSHIHKLKRMLQQWLNIYEFDIDDNFSFD